VSMTSSSSTGCCVGVAAAATVAVIGIDRWEHLGSTLEQEANPCNCLLHAEDRQSP
jgi:hypothetical protein